MFLVTFLFQIDFENVYASQSMSEFYFLKYGIVSYPEYVLRSTRNALLLQGEASLQDSWRRGLFLRKIRHWLDSDWVHDMIILMSPNFSVKSWDMKDDPVDTYLQAPLDYCNEVGVPSFVEIMPW